MIGIPQKIKDEGKYPQVKKLDRQVIVAATLLGLSNQDAFLLYHPEFRDGNGRINKAGATEAKHFWSYGKVKEYRDEYEREIAEFLGRGQTSQKAGDTVEELSETEKDESVRIFQGKVYRAMRNVDESDIEALTDIGGLAQKTKVLKDDEEQQIRPLRFLPERCSACRARLFCESMVLNGEALDLCQYCECRRIAEENGHKFDPKKDFIVPKEILEGLAAKNNVTVADILAGKVEN